jgi:hypothetical protein
VSTDSHTPAYYSQTLVVQPDLFGAVLPEKVGSTPVAAHLVETGRTEVYYPEMPVVQRCTTLREAAGSTATAKAHTPFALTRSGGTPMPARAAVKSKVAPVTGRVEGGPACIGCVSYKPLNGGEGACSVLGRTTAASDRRPCGAYRFYGSAPRKEPNLDPPVPGQPSPPTTPSCQCTNGVQTMHGKV